MLPILLRPDSARSLAIYIFACLSPAVAFALERANLDVFDIVVIVAATLYAARGPTQRILSYIVYLLIGLLKYYPLVLLGLIVRERPRIALACGGIAGLFLMALAAHYWGRLTPAELPQMRFFGNIFGGFLLPFGVTTYFRLAAPIGAIFFVVLVILVGFTAAGLAVRLKSEFAPADWDRPKFLLLAAGAVLTVGCFLAGVNVGYRASVLLLLFPGLLELQSRTLDRFARSIARCALGLALFGLWRQLVESVLINRGLVGADSIGSLVYIVLREALWWGLISVLAAIVMIYVTHAPLWRVLTRARPSA